MSGHGLGVGPRQRGHADIADAPVVGSPALPPRRSDRASRSASLLPSPIQRADNGPGQPRSASTSMPLSSASAGQPGCRAHGGRFGERRLDVSRPGLFETRRGTRRRRATARRSGQPEHVARARRSCRGCGSRAPSTGPVTPRRAAPPPGSRTAAGARRRQGRGARPAPHARTAPAPPIPAAR